MRPFKTNFSLLERDLTARTAGRVSDAAEIDSSRPDKARTGASRPPGYPRGAPSSKIALLARPQRPAESKRGDERKPGDEIPLLPP